LTVKLSEKLTYTDGEQQVRQKSLRYINLTVKLSEKLASLTFSKIIHGW